MAACDNAATVRFVGADAAADAAASVGAFANPSRNQDSLKTTLDGFFLPSMRLISPGQKPCVGSLVHGCRDAPRLIVWKAYCCLSKCLSL